MATHTGSRFITPQVESIASQVGVQVTLMVSDDGSSDDTLASIARALPPGMPLNLVQSALPGGSAGRNFFRLMLATDATGHDFVALADQDDRWMPEKLIRAVSCLEANEADAYSSAVLAFWPDGRERLMSQSPRQTSADFLFEGAGQGCTFVLRAALFMQLRAHLEQHQLAFASIHYHDWTLYALARALGKPWFFDARPGMHYRQHAGNDTGARGSFAALVKRLALIRSGWYGAQTRSIARLCQTVGGSGASALATRYVQLASAAMRGRRLSLAAFAWRCGRRRLGDRIVLVVAALLGHLDAPESGKSG
jgi:rhamnosyltransferase